MLPSKKITSEVNYSKIIRLVGMGNGAPLPIPMENLFVKYSLPVNFGFKGLKGFYNQTLP